MAFLQKQGHSKLQKKRRKLELWLSFEFPLEWEYAEDIKYSAHESGRQREYGGLDESTGKIKKTFKIS